MSVPWYLMAKGKGGGGYKTASGPIVSVNDALAAPLRSLIVNIEPVQEGSGDPSPDNVRPISGWSAVNVWVKPTYDPTSNPTATLQLGDTYYGGTLDVLTGEMRVTKGYSDAGSLTWYKHATYGNVFYAGGGSLGVKAGETGAIQIISNAYKPVGCCPIATLSTSDISVTIQQGYPTICICDDSHINDDAPTFKSAVSGVQLVYELATPIIIPLTATEISSLQGQNNVWADTGDVTIEYLASGGADPDLMKLAVAFMGRE